MRILAIETSGRYGSVAALEGKADGAELLHQIVLGGDQRTAQALTPALRELLAQINWTPRCVELVAVAVDVGQGGIVALGEADVAGKAALREASHVLESRRTPATRAR